MKYTISMCPKCGLVQSSHLGVRFTCRGCKASKKFRKVDGLAQVKTWGVYDNPFDAVIRCQALKEKRELIIPKRKKEKFEWNVKR